MAGKPFLAKLGLRTLTAGSLASLAVSMGPEADDAARTGFYADSDTAPTELNFVVAGTRVGYWEDDGTLHVLTGGLVVGGTDFNAAINVDSTGGGGTTLLHMRYDNAAGGGVQFNADAAAPRFAFLQQDGSGLGYIAGVEQATSADRGLALGLEGEAFGRGTSSIFIDEANSLVQVNRPLDITDTTASISDTTGALTVAGGVGVDGDVYIGSRTIIEANQAIHVASGVDNSADAGVHIDGSSQNGTGTMGGIAFVQQNALDRRLYMTGNDTGFSFNWGTYSENNGDFQLSDGEVAVAAEFRLGKAGQRVMRGTDENMSLVMNTDTDPGAFTAAADTDGYDTYIYAQSGGAHSAANPRGGDIIVTPGVAGSGGAGRDGRLDVQGLVRVSDTAAATSTSSAALVVAGGAGIAGGVYVGAAIRAPSLVAATSPFLEARVSGDTSYRISVRSDGRISWGSGTVAADTLLYREAAKEMVWTIKSLKHDTDIDTGTIFTGRYRGWNSSGTDVDYTRITHDVVTNTAGSHDGEINLWVADGGILSTKLKINQDGVKVQNGVLDYAASRVGFTQVNSTSTLTHTQVAVEQITTSGITTSLWVSPSTGDTVSIRNNSGGANTISGNGNNIEGSATFALNDGESVTLIYNGTEWIVF